MGSRIVVGIMVLGIMGCNMQGHCGLGLVGGAVMIGHYKLYDDACRSVSKIK